MNTLQTWLTTTTVTGTIAIVLCLAAVPVLRRFLGAQAAQAVWLFPLLLLLVSWRSGSPVGVLPPMADSPAVVVKITPAFSRQIPPARPSPAPFPWLLAVWSAGAAACLALLATRTIRTATLLRGGADLTRHPRIYEILASLPAVPARLHVRETSNLLSPAVSGIFTPVVLLPPGWTDQAATAELRWVLLHEIGHIRRGDLLWRWAFQIVRAIHWFNPLVWLADRTARADQEMACDEWVLGRKDADAALYGEAILQIAGRLSATRLASPGAAGMAESRRGLSRRIRHLAGARPRGAGAIAAALLSGVLALLILSPATGSSASTQTAAPEPAPAGNTVPNVEIETKFIELSSNSLASLFDVDAVGGNTILEEPEYRRLLQKLNGAKGVDLLSAPKVTVPSQKQAKIQVTREFRFPSTFEPSKDPKGAPTPGGFASRDVGVTLDVTPVLLPDGEIVCSVKPEVVEFLGFIDYGASKPARTSQDDALEQALAPGENSGQSINKPVFKTRRMQTSVALRPGQTALFGGLVSTSKQVVSEVIDGKASEQEREIKRTLYFMLTARLAEEKGTPIGADPSPVQNLPKLSQKPTPAPEDKTATSSNDDLPFGVAVEGKPGFITSPFAPDSGQVDVRGFPAGTQVKCPYTGRMFLVP